MSRFVCIHGHFYQPPRENAWLEDIEIQDSAYPYHDWNERVTAESYSPNSAARILSSDNRIIDIVNNYSRMSFNFGPTLLSWMEKKAPDVYNAILEADKESQERFSGHGAAMAQVYNHMIMPLANQRDKRTQVLWCIEDFRSRFNREPEGMWLPETAVDTDTLEVLAEAGIKFTVLSPYQAGHVRKIQTGQNSESKSKKSTGQSSGDKKNDEGEWTNVSGGKVDPKRPYLCNLPSGNTIVIFFYDGPISQEVGFGDLLANGERFANRLMGAFADNGDPDQLVHIATDGETYGHHHNHGDMALAYCLYHIESRDLATITIYGEYLENHPPKYEIEIVENSSWSCMHGIERWRSDCGCHTGGEPGWNQQWRKPLRDSLDWLSEQFAETYADKVATYLNDPWGTRDRYIEVVLNRDEEHVQQFLNREANRKLSQEESVRLLHLLEMQRHSMLMYTSCGWFFNEISGIETIQVIQYADRGIQLAQEMTEREGLESGFRDRLAKAPSNIPRIDNGAQVYKQSVKPARLDMNRVGAHYAVSSLFKDYPEITNIYCYTTKSEEYDHKVAGKLRLGIGRVWVKSDITWHESHISFAMMYLGDHILNGGVRSYQGEEAFQEMEQEIKTAFMKSDISEVFGYLDSHFGTHHYTLWHLFKDEQRKIFQQILDSSLERIEFSLRRIYEDEYPLMQAMREIHMPLPAPLTNTLEYILNADIRKSLESEEIDFERLESLVGEVRKWQVELDTDTIPFVTSQRIVEMLKSLANEPEDTDIMQEAHHILEQVQQLPVSLDLWEAQNIYFDIGKQLYEEMKQRAESDDEAAEKWIQAFGALGDYLRVRFE